VIGLDCFEGRLGGRTPTMTKGSIVDGALVNRRRFDEFHLLRGLDTRQIQESPRQGKCPFEASNVVIVAF